MTLTYLTHGVPHRCPTPCGAPIRRQTPTPPPVRPPGPLSTIALWSGTPSHSHGNRQAHRPVRGTMKHKGRHSTAMGGMFARRMPETLPLY